MVQYVAAIKQKELDCVESMLKQHAHNFHHGDNNATVAIIVMCNEVNVTSSKQTVVIVFIPKLAQVMANACKNKNTCTE